MKIMGIVYMYMETNGICIWRQRYLMRVWTQLELDSSPPGHECGLFSLRSPWWLAGGVAAVYSAGPARAAGPRLPPVRFEPVGALRREIRTLINHQINIAGWRPRRIHTAIYTHQIHPSWRTLSTCREGTLCPCLWSPWCDLNDPGPRSILT